MGEAGWAPSSPLASSSNPVSTASLLSNMDETYAPYSASKIFQLRPKVATLTINMFCFSNEILKRLRAAAASITPAPRLHRFDPPAVVWMAGTTRVPVNSLQRGVGADLSRELRTLGPESEGPGAESGTSNNGSTLCNLCCVQTSGVLIHCETQVVGYTRLYASSAREIELLF